MKKSISVVIPNYNGEHLLKKNLPSVLAALQYAQSPFEIIISDDNSSDNSVRFLKENYPMVAVIESHENLGFSRNINKGLRKAKMDLVLALNSDVTLNEDYFTHQFEYFSSADTFGVMGLMKDPKSQEIIVGAKICRQNFFGEMETTKNIVTKPLRSLETFYLSGANALIDRAKLEKLNYFNEIYSPFYKEDTDLSLLAWRAGWRCYFEPKSVAFHETSSTIKSFNKQSYIQQISKRNKFIFHYIHLTGIQRALYFSKLFVDVLTRWLVLDFTFYRTLLAFLTMVPMIDSTKVSLNQPLITARAVIKEISQKQKLSGGQIF